MVSFKTLIVAALPLLGLGLAQDETVTYTDKASGVVFNAWPAGDLTFGMALPPNSLTTANATEFIGLLTCTSPKGLGTGWCGVSLGGGMNENLLVVAYPSAGQVLTSFRWATDYTFPTVYTGNAKLTQISSATNATHYSVIFRCQNCLAWSQGGSQGAAPTSEGYLVLGWAHATASPSNAACPSAFRVGQHESQGIFAGQLNAAAVNPSYTAWAAKATATVAGSCGVTTSVAPAPKPTSQVPGVAGCAKSWTVRAGEYCYLIATNNGLSLDQLLGLNPGLVCNPLQIGTLVCLQR